MANVAAPDGFEWIDDGPPAPAAVTPDFSGAPMPPPRPPELNQPPVARQEFNPPRPADVPLPPPRPAELGKSTASKDDDDDDLGRPKPPDGFEWVQDQPTLFDVIAESARKGLHRGLEDTWEGAKVVGRGSFKGTEPGPGMDFSPVGQLLQTKLADGWKDPQWWAAQITHGLAASSPTLAAGALGGAAGASVAGPPGALVGGVGGFALGSALQTIAPAYQRARAEGLDHDAAVDRAMLETGIAGAFGAAMGAAPAAPVFGKTATGALKAPISEALAQIFGVQPGLMAAHKATENVVEGKPVGEGVPEAAIIGAATGPFMVAGHAALRAGKRAVMGEAPAAAQSADPVGDFIRDADEASARAEARAAGRKTKEEIDEFIRQKDAADAAREAAKRAAAEPSPAEPVEPAQQQRQPADRQAAGPDADNAVRQRRPADAPGRPVSPAAEPGADRGPAPNPAVEAENKALRAAGWSDDEIALLSPKERTAELRDAGYEAETAASRQDPVAEAGAGQPARAENADAAVRADAPKPQQTEVIEPRQAWDRLQSIYDGVGPMLENPATATPETIAKARADLAALRNRFGDADSAEHKALREGIDRVADHITTAEIDAKAGTRAAPIKVAEPKDVEPARARVEPEPSEGQKAAGNYRKGHIEYDGLPVSIENPKGSVRRGVDPDGKPWSVEMPSDYGYIKGTKGADKDHVDILIGDKAPNGTAYVIDQQDPRTGKFDEHKVVVGVDSVGDAARLYHKSFSDGSGIERVGAINKVPISHLQDWLAQGRRTKPMAPAEPLPAAAPVSHEIAPVPTPPSKKRRNSSGAPVTLLGWLRSNGGIQDQGGELRSRDLAKRYIGLVNSRGMTLDDARLRAAEAGYFGPMKDERMADTTVNDLLEKLDQHPTYSSDDQEALDRIADKAAQKRAEKRHEKDIARARHQIEREMQAHDLQPDTEAIDLAARIMVEEGQAWDEAFERATMRLAHETPETKAALDATATEDGYDAIPWDDYLESPPAQEAAAGATGGRDQAAGGSRQEGDRGGEEGADQRRPQEPARAGEDAQDRAPRDEGKRGKPGEVEATARAEVQAGDADETVSVRLTPKGPWDFNDTFPAMDAAKIAALETEGRYVPGAEGEGSVAEHVASIFDEAIETELMPAWRAIREGHKALPGIMRGEGKPPNGIKKHDEWARQVRNRINEARQDIENTKAALEEYFSEAAANAAVREARRRELGTVRTQGPAPVEKPADAPTTEPGAEGKPQTVIPGAEKISDADLAQKKADEGLKAKAPQKAPGGMFDEAETAPQLFDAPSRNHDTIEKGELPVDDARERERAKKIAEADAKGLQLTAGKSSADKLAEVEPSTTRAFYEKLMATPAPQTIVGPDGKGWAVRKAAMFERSSAEGYMAIRLSKEPGVPPTHFQSAKGVPPMSREDAAAMAEAIAKHDAETGKTTYPADLPNMQAPAPKAAQSPVEALRDKFMRVAALEEPGFDSIVEARKFLRDAGWEAKPERGPENKQIEEAIEHALVEAAREIAQHTKLRPSEIFGKLVVLYEAQPRLNARSSKSVAEQAYSTPAPLAYVASRLAGIDATKTVLEPSAGNGMLLIEADPKKVTANEIDATRAEALRAQGFGRVTEEDATRPGALPKGADVVIANPPFGAVREGGESKTFRVGEFATTNIDFAIALNALQAMKPDGRAVLIVGGVKAESQAERAKGYQAASKRKFYYRLLRDYNVADVFTVAGDLYARQGAGWPVDVIVIDGKGPSSRKPLSAEPPPLLQSWGEVKEKLNVPQTPGPERETPGASGLRGEEAGSSDPASPAGEQALAQGRSREPVAGGRPLEPRAATRQPRGVGDKPAVGQPEGMGRGAVGDGAQPAPRPVPDGSRADYLPDPDRGRSVEANAAGQAPYRPASTKAAGLGTLIPANLAVPAADSLDRIQRTHGQIDHFVAAALAYPMDDAGPYFVAANGKKVRPFSAEQIDAAALAIDNVERGSGFIVGDQTGIGKGRVVAAAIRYAHRKGMLPVFVTEKPDLYGDMWRDLHDIGWDRHLGRPIEMFMTNSGVRVPLDERAVQWVAEAQVAADAGEKAPPREGAFSTSQSNDVAARQMHEIIAGTSKPDVVFTTYDQMNSVAGEETERRSFLRQVAPKAFLIMDEAHNAGGQGLQQRGKKDAAPPRSKVFREAVARARAVVYSSATYAKSPQVMDLFSRTDMLKAVDDPEKLGELIAKGGVPMQQIVSAMLAKSGQYLRRERSFEGVSYEVETAPVDQQSYETFTEGLSTIFRFDKFFSDERKDLAAKYAAELGAGNAQDGGVGERGANTTEFSSIMHNAISQMVLSIKAKAAAARAIKALQAGERPVIALSATMESFIKDFTEAAGIREGDPINLDFGDVLRRYLERTRRVTIKMPDDTKKHVMIPDADMAGVTRQMFEEAKATLAGIDMADLPISPIDAIRHEIQKAGYSVREVTGRDTMIDYGGAEPTLVARPAGERGAAGKRVTIRMFNSGDVDAVILNRSGSTGVSMHAGEKFKNQQPRRMILVQADPNIDVHMQMLGRVHRTGQVALPAYSQLAADIPAEVRPTAVLMKKMASLNANTTAARKSKFTGDAVDFMNKYGDIVAAQAMLDDPRTNARLGYPVRMDEDGQGVVAGSMAKVTGRLTLLKPAEQQKLLDTLTENYTALIERLDAEGANDLEAKSLDLQAKVLDGAIIRAASGDSPFQDAVRLEQVSIKAQGRAMAPAEVLGAVLETLDIKHPDGGTFARTLPVLKAEAHQRQRATISRVTEEAKTYADREIKATLKNPDAIAKARKKADDTIARWQSVAAIAYPGNIVTVEFQGAQLPAVVLDFFSKTTEGQNPVALSKWHMTVAVPDSARTIGAPLSQVWTPQFPKPDGKAGVPLAPASYMDTPASIEGLFEKARKEGRENRWMFAGNILAAYDQANGQGQIVNHTMEDGSSRPAILMPKAFKKVDFMASRPIRFTDARHVLAFLDKLPDGEVASTDGAITIRRTRGSYEFDLPAARATGGRYYADGVVRAVYDAWEKKGSRMRADLVPDKAREVVAAMQKVGAVFEVRDHQDIAEKIIAADKPKPLAQVAAAGATETAANPPRGREGAELRRMVDEVADIFETILPREIGYQIAREIRVDDRSVIERSGGNSQRSYITGLYDSAARMAYVATNTVDPANTAYHEGWHVAQDLGLASPQELAVLRSPSEQKRMRAYVARSKGLARAEAMPALEIEGYVAGDVGSALHNGREPPPLHATAIRVFSRLYLLWRRLRNFFAGRGFQTVEDIFSRFQRGDMTARPPEQRTGSRLHGEEAMNAQERATAQTGRFFAETTEPPPEPDPTSRYFGDRTLRQRIGDRIDRLPDRVAVNEAFLDMHARVAKTQDEIAGGAAIPANLDTYKAKRRLPGQIAAQEQDFRHDFVEPLLTEAKAAGLTRQDMAEWLFAKHAPERNAAMDAIDPRNEGRGSGITDAEAAAIIERLTRDGKSGALANVESRVAAIRDFALDRAVETGLMSQEHADAISASYEHYVPLQGWDDPTQAHPDAVEQRPGGGMRVKGSEFRKAFGRRTVSGDPLATLINNAMRTIDRAEKNKALRVAWRFLKSIPADELSGVRLDKGRMVKTIDPETGMVAYREEAAWQHRDNVVPLKIGGVPHYIVFDDPVIAKAWMRMSAEQLHWTVGWAGSVVNTAKSVWTHWNPEFVVRHFGLRYPIEGALNAAEHGGKAALGSFKSYPMGPAFRAIRAYHGLDAAARADLARKASEPGASAHDRYLAAYDEMRQNGGLMAWSDFGGVDRIKKRIDHALLTMDRNPVRASIGYLRGVHEAIDHVTSAMDNAQRLVAYMQARERGSNRIDAAMTAREATVDFALKGTMANYLTLMWPFANTAGQTASRMVRAARRNPREMLGKVIGGMFSLGMAAALYAYLYGGNDEDGVPFFEKTGDWTRRLHIVLPIPGVKDDKKRPYMLQVSLPYNYAMPFVAGQTVIALMMRAEGRSKQPVGKILGNLGHSVLEGTTPIAQEHSLVGKMTPELMRPFLHVAMNQNWHGAPVHPSDEPWNKGIPASEKGFRSTAEMWKRLARIAHQTTGVDYHPEDYREVMSYFTSTLQGVASRAGTAVGDVRQGKAPDPTDVPVLHALIGGGKQYDAADRRAYYEARDIAFAAETRFKDMKKQAQLDPSKVADVETFFTKNVDAIRAAKVFRSATGTMSDLTKQMNRLEADTAMTPTERERALDALRERQLSTMNRVREKSRAMQE